MGLYNFLFGGVRRPQVVATIDNSGIIKLPAEADCALRDFVWEKYLGRENIFFHAGLKMQVWKRDGRYHLSAYEDRDGYYGIMDFVFQNEDIFHCDVKVVLDYDLFKIDFILNGRGSKKFLDPKEARPMQEKFVSLILRKILC